MESRSFIIVILLFLLIFSPLGLISPGWSETVVDHGIYADLLKKHVHEGKVDYQGFKTEEAQLDRYLKILEKVDPKRLSRNEQFAFYINAYNAWTIKLILSGYPGVKSIKDLGSFLKSPWKKKICRIDGNVITLDDIEHKILRPKFKDPRVHFAINCAASSCPPLAAKPYLGRSLNRQLDDSAQAFINTPEQNYLRGHTLYVSKIFKWFSEDFNNDIIRFILKYANADLRKNIAAEKTNIEIQYLHYDWALNGE